MKKSTPEAMKLIKALRLAGLNAEREHDDGYKSVDIFLPDSKICIEVDGPKHLTDSAQILADFKREHFSDLSGYNTIHIPNTVINSDIGGVVSALAEAAKIKEEEIKLFKANNPA